MVDATFRFEADRRIFAAAFGSAQEPFLVECRTPAAILAARAESRAGAIGQASDADAAIALKQNVEFEALDEIPARHHVILRTDRPVASVLDDLEAALDERLLAPVAGARSPTSRRG